MEIVLLSLSGCPHRLEARRNLDAALVAAGVDAVVDEREVRSPDDARRAGMNGSPTILVDGVDLFAADPPGTIACRLYADGSGVRGAPSVDAILTQLAS